MENRTVLVVGAGMASLQVGNALTQLPGTQVVYAFRRMPAILPSTMFGITIFWLARECPWIKGQVLDILQNLVASIYYGPRYLRLFPKLQMWKPGKDKRIPTVDLDGLFIASLRASAASVVSGPKAIWEHGFVDLDGSVYRCDDIVWATGYKPAESSFMDASCASHAHWVGMSQHHGIPLAVGVAEAEQVTRTIAQKLKQVV